MRRIGAIIGLVVILIGVLDEILHAFHFFELIESLIPKWAEPMISVKTNFIVIIVGFFLMALAWADYKRETSRDIEKRDENRPLPQPLPPEQIQQIEDVPSADDPRIAIVFFDKRTDQLYKKTALILENTGRSEALEVRIQTINLRGQEVRFPHVAGVIKPQGCEQFDPDTGGRWGRVNTSLFIDALVKEWESYNTVAMTEVPIPLKVTYKNFSRTADFETTCTLVFKPHVERRNKRAANENQGQVILFCDYVHRKLPPFRPL